MTFPSSVFISAEGLLCSRQLGYSLHHYIPDCFITALVLLCSYNKPNSYWSPGAFDHSSSWLECLLEEKLGHSIREPQAQHRFSSRLLHPCLLWFFPFPPIYPSSHGSKHLHNPEISVVNSDSLCLLSLKQWILCSLHTFKLYTSLNSTWEISSLNRSREMQILLRDKPSATSSLLSKSTKLLATPCTATQIFTSEIPAPQCSLWQLAQQFIATFTQ